MSFIICLIVILASSYGFFRRAALDEVAVQCHSGFVPRVCGLAIYTSILVLIPLLSFGFIPLSVVFNLNAGEITGLISSAIRSFLWAWRRILVCNVIESTSCCFRCSSIVAILLFKVWLTKFEFLLDVLLTFAPFAIFFTVFATMGVVNAFNLIDGLNGLSSFVRFLPHCHCQL